ncbi:G protein coupled receptor [Trichuris trichiura]|uniref:G protein coupled receptor n=1 Tax=Trichuris trichiura TaxID=36087 RepID=A0A077YVP5_TRITR|nr:G protein coupled receptor [Trichuris trichiura]
MSCEEESYLPQVSQATMIIGRFIFPFVFIMGVIGNILILLALRAAAVSSKASYFLIAMAVADLCFFFCVLPNHIISFPSLALQRSYFAFYVRSKMTFTALANWFSVASIWLAIAVTFERLLVIRKPLHARLFFRKWHFAVLIGLIYAISLLVVAYNFFWFYPTEITITTNCNSTLTIWTLKAVNRTAQPTMYEYVSTSLKVIPHITLTIPLFMLTVLNSALFYYLRKAHKMSLMLTGVNQQKTVELRVALVVVSIIGTFLVCQIPSAVSVSNILVVFGKAFNFVVYCASSSSFRKKVQRLLFLRTVSKHFNNSSHRHRHSNNTVTSQLDSEHESMLQEKVKRNRIGNLLEMKELHGLASHSVENANPWQ